MEFLVIFEMIMAFIQECMENRNRPDVERDLNNPGVMVRLGLWRILRRSTNLSGRALSQEVRDYMALLRDMNSQEVAALCDEAEAAK